MSARLACATCSSRARRTLPASSSWTRSTPWVGTAAPDWAALARGKQTIVFYMGLGARKTISSQLIAAGRAATTPVAVIASGATPKQQVLRTTLAGLAKVDAGAVPAPALIVVGEVAALADRNAWYRPEALRSEAAGPRSPLLRRHA